VANGRLILDARALTLFCHSRAKRRIPALASLYPKGDAPRPAM
jgi:hypothetical protein